MPQEIDILVSEVGVRLDRDMHGASFACLLEGFEL